jgi:hypothetical protein
MTLIFLRCNKTITKQYIDYGRDCTSILLFTIVAIFVGLSTIQVTHAFTFNNIYSKPHLSDVQELITTYGVDVGKIILYGIVIIILILTRLKWAKHGRKITKRKIKVETVFFSILGSIVIFDSFYDVGVPIFYLVPYLILFFGLQQYSYLHSNRLISFWKESKSGSIYVKGGTHIHFAYVIGTTLRIIISVLFIGSLFSSSPRGLIPANESTIMLATIAFDFLLVISLGLLIGINRRIFIRYNLINEGRENVLEK